MVLSGCSIKLGSSSQQGPAPDPGGIFKSADRGETWVKKSAVPSTSGKPGSITQYSANQLVMDPSDRQALYLATPQNGLWFTYDGGDNWQKAKTLGDVGILSVAVDPGDKCTIYATVGNKLYQTVDCARTWEQIYFDTTTTVTLNSIAIDHHSPNVILMGTSRGDILLSEDRGRNWRAASRPGGKIDEITVNPSDSRIVLAIQQNKALWRSLDGGRTWESMKDKLKGLKKASGLTSIAFSRADARFMAIAGSKGLLTSTDNGETWKEVDLVIPDKNAKINALAVSPKNLSEVYYVTNTAFFRSTDGGATWASKKMPTARAGWSLVIDPENTDIIYLGVRTIEKK